MQCLDMHSRDGFVLMVYTWARLRPLLASLSWVEFYEGQQQDWLRKMSDPRNLVGRVWVDPGHGMVELYYERYYRRTNLIESYGTFVRVANFDLFYRECPSWDSIRVIDCGCDCYNCYEKRLDYC